MKNLLFDLLQFKTTSDNSDELHTVIDYLDNYFNDYDVITRKYEKNGKPSLVVTSQFTKSPKIFLNGHLDVVPATYKNAFKPFEKDGKVYARGASDMKGTVAAMIVSFCELLQEKKNYDIGLMLTTDEEVGGFDGVRYLLDEEGYSCEVAFIPDAGESGWKVCTDEKALWFNLQVAHEGESVHSSVLWKGKNSVNELWKTYRDIRDDFVKKWGKLKNQEFWKPTINLAALNGGIASNVVPDYAEMTLDVRFPADIPFDEIEKIIKDNLERRNVYIIGKGIKGYGMHYSEDNIFIKSWENVAQEYGKETSFFKAFGGSDARFFYEFIKNVSVVMCKPNTSAHHIKNEWVDYNDLVVFKDAIKDWVKNISS